MAVQTPALTRPNATTSGQTTSAHRLLGVIGMLTSPFLFLSFAVNGFSHGDSNRLGAALGFVFTIGWFCNVFGLHALGAAGQRFPARLLLWVELVGVVLAAAFQIFEYVDPSNTSIFFMITDIAWPLSMVLLLIGGIVIAVARRFEGWLRFTPLIAGLWLPLAMVALPLLGQTVGQAVGGLHTVLGWGLLGYAVYRGGRLTSRG